MIGFIRAVAVAAAAALLSGCAADQAPAPDMGSETPSSVTRQFTAGPGDVMALVFDPDEFGDAPPDGEVVELVYVGMRSPTEAVFQRRFEKTFEGPLADTVLNDVFVPLRPQVVGTGAEYVTTETRDSRTRQEFTLDPSAGGAQFGQDDKAITLTEITPGRVVYVVEQL